MSDNEINLPEDKPAPEWTPMADPGAAVDDKATYGNDAEGLKEAAKDLSEAREARTVKQAEAEPLVRTYQYLTGDKAGEAIPDNQTITAERAARDVSTMREYEAASQQPQQSDIANAIDSFRNAYAANPQQQQQIAEQPQGQQQEQPQATEQAQQPEQATPPGIDPEIAQALNNPKIRAALEAEVQSAEQARAAFAQGARQAAQVAAASVLSNFPELANVPAAHLQTAIDVIARQDPQRAMAINGALQRTQALLTASQQAEAAQQQIQAQNLKQWIASEDAKFTQATANETPETMRRIAENIIALAEDYGVSREQLGAVWQSQPVLRSAAFQPIMVDAARYRMATKEVAAKVHREIPLVQRPGVSRPHNSNDEVDSAMAKFRSDPNPKSAAALLTARRRAARG
jgi:hypothetical protein